MSIRKEILDRADGGTRVERRDLVTLILGTRDPGRSAHHALEWLCGRVDAERAICVWVNGSHLEALSGIGLAEEALEGFRIDLEDLSHPLVLVLHGDEPVEFQDTTMRRWPRGDMPFEAEPFLAVPVGRFGDRRASGLLLLAMEDPAPDKVEEVRWIAGLLGSHLASILYERLDGMLGKAKERLGWYSGILGAVTDPLLLTDSEGRMLVANRGAETLLVADDTMSEGRRHAVALNNMMLSASLLPAGETTGHARRELLLVDPVDGTDLLFELLNSPLPIRPGETGTISVLRNVSDLHYAIEELEENYRLLRSAETKTRAERDRFDLILSSVLDPILVTDTKGDLILMNPPAERLFTVGETRDFDAERRVMANDAVLSSFLSNFNPWSAKRWRGELRLSDPASGRTLPVEAIAGRVEGRPGEDAAVVTILHDLSEAVEKAQLYEQIKRQSEDLQVRVAEATAELAEQNELLQRQASQLEQASALKSQFLANVSHELRTPLNAMLSWTTLLLEGVYGPLVGPHREKLERVHANGRHLATIINDVLDISRIEAGKVPMEIVEFRLAELFDEVMSEVEPLIDSAHLDVTWDAPRDLPGIVSDRGKVKQILINLLSNALKFTEEGTVRIEAALEDEERVRISVADTGIGISPELQKIVFEPFGQSASSRSSYRAGAGLGLSICRRFANVLGGTIDLESVEGEGSTFTLVIRRRLEVN